MEIRNRLGLHARAAVLLVKTTERFDAEVTIAKDGQIVNGRSIMGVMMLAAEQGSHIEVATRGPDAAEALEAIRALVEARFDEPE
ncbi:MAG TPA: HPr family phosphocarrier protein [Gaiellaceae bacterium]|nr:HPr family phosphocarrier protein [Gaiellaceae bacterium]